MKKFKILLLLIPLLFITEVKADTLTDYCTKYWYANDWTGDLSSKDYFCGSHVYLNAWGYNRYPDSCIGDNCWSEYLVGFNTKINYNFESNSNYVIKMTLSYNGLQDGELQERMLKRYNYSENFWEISGAKLNNVQYSNLRQIINSENNYTYLFDVTWFIYTNSSVNQINVGFNGHRTANYYYSFGFLVHYYDVIVTIPNIEILKNVDETIIDQNQTQINQNDTIINQNQQTNDKLDDLNDSLNDSDTSGATNEAENFFSGFETNTFGLTSIITAPLDLISSITSSSCSPLPLTVPFVDNSFNLPCMSTIYEEYFGTFLDIYQTITFGIVAYWVCVRIFALVKDFKNPDHDEIEVLDL